MPKLCEHKQLLNTRPEASPPVRACVVSSPIFHPKCCHNEVIELVGSPARIHKIVSSTSTIIEHHHRHRASIAQHMLSVHVCVCVYRMYYTIFFPLRARALCIPVPKNIIFRQRDQSQAMHLLGARGAAVHVREYYVVHNQRPQHTAKMQHVVVVICRPRPVHPPGAILHTLQLTPKKPPTLRLTESSNTVLYAHKNAHRINSETPHPHQPFLINACAYCAHNKLAIVVLQYLWVRIYSTHN